MQTDTPRVIRPRRKSPLVRLAQSWQLYVLLLPAVAYLIIFHYIPLYGVQIAFRDYRPRNGFLGSTWVGLKHFARFLKSPNTWKYVRNTLSLSIWGVLIAFPLKIFLALVINEIASAKYKKFVQTVTYAPYFISVTVLISMVNLLLAKNTGVLTQLFEAMGLPAGTWLTSPGAFQWVYVISGMWQQTGWGAVIFLAALAGVDVPEETKILIGEVESVELSEEFAHEKLSPVLAMYHAKDFDEALDKAEKLVCDGGHGHTASLYIHPAQKEKIMKHAERMEACRIVINTPSSFGGIGDLYNFKMAPSLTLGCGTWGGNSVSENVGVKHLLNVKTVAERRENMLWFRAPQKVYFKKGCMPVALDELGTVMGKKKCFIVTDTFLYKNGYVAPIEEKLDQLGIQHTCFYDVAPDPNLSSALKGAQAMRLFEPDCIIALGGGSAMDAGKIMWVMYEHPEVDFLDMAMRFMDIRKRVYTFPKMGEKAYFVAIPTSSGTGSEVTPFAVITDDRTGTKYPLADYELLPNMAIVDADNMMNQPRGLTSASGVDVLTHGLEAYASMMATDYTDGLALKSMKNVFDYLPRAYEYGAADPEARQKMADASCMAGMAFANAFLGVCHSMAHKLGAYHHLPHGVANALMICHVLRYNAAEVPAKMGTFPQYDHPHTLARYAECARFCGVCGKDDEETLDLFIDKIEELKAKVGIKKSIAEYGISEETFMSTLDQMVEDAFDDQCTGANPRYPLLKEIKAMYLKAYYGEKA